MTTLNERGQREVVGSLKDALARLRRRRADLQAQMGILEAELSDLGKIEGAISTAIELARQ